MAALKKTIKQTETIEVATHLMSVGRRKRAVARARMTVPGKGEITINGLPIETFFPWHVYKDAACAPLLVLGKMNEYSFEIKVAGGGARGQADAVCLAISRALTKLNSENKPSLRAAGFMTRDSREKERKKFGLKKARRAPQWAKR